jgi:hypothetical protein
MQPILVHYIPILTTLLAIPFALEIFRRWRAFPERLHLLWWAIGVATYGAGTFTEAYTTLFGWNVVTFKAWYITGALLGGAPLAQGTVYLMLKRKAADRLTAMLILYVAIAAICVSLAPIDYSLVEAYRLTGRVLAWPWVRLFSPVVNLYAVVFLIGGAILSAIRYSHEPATKHRMFANILIAIGAILPGIGGSATRFGYTEVLYVTELIGLLLTWTGYRISVRPVVASAGRSAPAR